MPPAPLTLTRGHVLALGALSLALAVLSFFLGVEVGRRQVPVAPPPAPAGLVPEEVKSGQIEELISKAESKQGAPVDFPKALVAPPDGANTALPTTGWAIQVAEFPDAASADALVAKLVAEKLAAYRVGAVVEGRAVQRVRVGGYATKDAATGSMPKVAETAGVPDGVVVPAP